ncbi:MAG: hypothetical protein ACT4OU_04345 [Hyphomicrobium sp.]
MKDSVITLFLAAIISVAFTSVAAAHILPWRKGESRMKGFGHCAKGPCMKRYDFSASKPHRHVGGRIVFDRIAPGYDFTKYW